MRVSYIPHISNIVSLVGQLYPTPLHVWADTHECTEINHAYTVHIPCGHVDVCSITHNVISSLKPSIACSHTVVPVTEENTLTAHLFPGPEPSFPHSLSGQYSWTHSPAERENTCIYWLGAVYRTWYKGLWRFCSILLHKRYCQHGMDRQTFCKLLICEYFTPQGYMVFFSIPLCHYYCGMSQ